MLESNELTSTHRINNIMKRILLAVIVLLYATTTIFADNNTGIIKGKVRCEDEALSFASVWIKGTTMGTSTNIDGSFSFTEIPDGTYTIQTQTVGYKMGSRTITIKNGKPIIINFILAEDAIGLDQVVVTADRNKRSRKNAPVIVSTISPQLLVSTQSTIISEGLNFCPGLRMENNCQNCGFSQLRMNGMEGAYSQILINSRPIFSGLAGVYGLEMIPSNMIERIEVTRGGGSALFGGNAIAGTVNLITKDPINNSYEVSVSNNISGVGMSGTGGTANDYNTNFNTSIVSESGKTGMSIFGFYRNKEEFDANNDGYSEISRIENTTLGARIFHRLGMRSKITADFYNISEKRRGGDHLDKVEHETMIAESVKNNILTASTNYELFLSEESHFSAYASGQKVDRDSYYGANKDLAAYGKTKDFTFNTGLQYKGTFGKSKIVSGIELNGGLLEDTKLGYYDKSTQTHTENSTIADQESYTMGSFLQYEYEILRLKASAGLRFDRYTIKDNASKNEDVTGNVLSPRINLLYDIARNLQVRVAFSQGYRAPQIFDEDLHIESSASRTIIHKNDESLSQESSYSYTASIDYTKEEDEYNLQFLAEAFYTQLNNPFVNEIGDPDANGLIIYTRKNAKEGATVKGINLEFNLSLGKDFTFRSGYTIQNSEYKEAQEYDVKKFLRTPDNYGFFTIDYDINKKFGISTTGNYTGEMLLPYHGPLLGSTKEIINTSKTFLDMGFKARYNINLKDSKLQVFAGVKNIFNSYQDDFDIGADRDPAYIYGPMNPRIVYFGIKIGNML
jgi:outer membrane receptor for ferrienterochelin and colicins